MGTPSLSSLASLLSPATNPAFNFPGSGTARALQSQSPAPQQDVAALVQPNQALALSDAYESAVYRSLETRQALSFQVSTLNAQLGQGGDGGSTASVDARQLTYDFFQESRVEELALFNTRTGNTGEKADPARQASFLGARQEISTRFQLSITISGAALNGFASTAEGAVDSNALLDRLLAVTDKLLGSSDQLLNDFFSLLEGGDGTFNAESLDDLFNEFISSIYDTLNGDLLPALGFSGNTGDGGGRQAPQAAGIQLEFSFEFSASSTTTQATVQQGDPIVLDLNGDGISLTTYQQGARFDLTGSGRAQQVAFVQGGDAFLALDRSGDGQINSGLELFGEQHGARNGFEELRIFDDNGDGVINKKDKVYDKLVLFRGNGATSAGGLETLASAGIDEIDLGYRDTDDRAAGGNRVTQIASYLRSDGSRGTAADALLNYIA